MNERIELVSDTEVRVRRNGNRVSADLDWMCSLSADTHIGGLIAWYESGGERWDALGLSALRDCINCLEATGSFAALADTSAGIFVGNWVRCARVDYKHGLSVGEKIKIVSLGSTGKPLVQSNRDRVWWLEPEDCLPLAPPAPVVRPYTLEEFLKAWRPGRSVKASGRPGCEYQIRTVERNQWNKPDTYFELGVGPKCTGFTADAKQFVELCTWADDNSPCGCVEKV